MLQHLAAVDGGDDGRRGIGDALGAQRGHDQVGGQDGVPVAGGGAQGEPDDGATAPAVLMPSRPITP